MIFMILPDYDVEDDLLQRLRHQDKAAMVDVYEQYFTSVYNYIRFKVGDTQVAEDLAGDVFLFLIEALHTHKAPRTSLRGWLFKVARNLIAQYHQTNQKITQIDFEEWVPRQLGHIENLNLENLMIENININQLIQAIQVLPIEQQDVIILRFGQALNLKETADIMGKGVSAIKSLQFRAIDGLRQIMSVE